MKKSDYFEKNPPDQVVRPWLKDIPSKRNRRSLDLTNAALLILDLQNYFLESKSHAFVPAAVHILPGINLMIDLFASWNRPVFFSRHLNTKQNAGMMKSWWRDLITEELDTSQLSSAVQVELGEVINKTQYDAFFKTNLERKLKDLRVQQLVIGGVMTHLCCETTARSAFMRGFEVYFTADGTATYHADFHIATLQNLAHGFANLILVKDILEQGQGAGHAKR